MLRMLKSIKSHMYVIKYSVMTCLKVFFLSITALHELYDMHRYFGLVGLSNPHMSIKYSSAQYANTR